MISSSSNSPAAKNLEGNIKQQFSGIVHQVAQDGDSQERENKLGESYDSLLGPGGSPELRRQNLETGEAKVVGVCKAEH